MITWRMTARSVHGRSNGPRAFCAYRHFAVLILRRTAESAARAAERNNAIHRQKLDAAKHSQDHITLRDMAKEYNVRGSRTRRGGRWHVSNLQNLRGRRRKVSTAGRKLQFVRIVLFREWR